MAVGVRSSGPRGAATSAGFWSFTTWSLYAVGGAATAENIALRCRAHNLHEAQQHFESHLPLLVREVGCPYIS